MSDSDNLVARLSILSLTAREAKEREHGNEVATLRLMST